jgi:hypothetical protein
MLLLLVLGLGLLAGMCEEWVRQAAYRWPVFVRVLSGFASAAAVSCTGQAGEGGH